MESERRPPDIGKSSILAGQAHRRIDLLLDRVKELTEERDAARRQHVAWIDALRAGDNADVRDAAHRALDEVISALDGWIEGAKSNHEALGHRGEPVDGECWRVFHVDDIRNMIEDARRQLGAEREFDSVVDHDDEIVQPDIDTVRRASDANADAYIDRIDELMRERDEARAAVYRLAAATEQAIRERDELSRRLERGHVCTAACEPNSHVLFVGREELDRVTAERDEAKSKLTEALTWLRSAETERDEARAAVYRQAAATEQVIRERDEVQERCLAHRGFVDENARLHRELDRVTAERDEANAMVASLRSVLSSIVQSIDNQESK